MEATIKRHCPVCKDERDFVRVVEAHVATEPLTMHTPLGTKLRQWVSKTVLPVAYCPDCGIVVHVGPSGEEVARDFEERQNQIRADEERRKRGSLSRSARAILGGIDLGK